MSPGIGANFFATHGIKQFTLDIVHAEAATLTTYKSDDRGATWLELDEEVLAGGADTSSVREFLVEMYRDWKIELTNGGAAQTAFSVDMHLTDDRSAGS